MDFSAAPLPAAVIATRLGLTGLATSAIAGTLTLTKTGTTARTATFPDGDIGVQSDTEERSADFTARVHGQYVTTATLTVTDPTPAQGHEYVVHVRNGTATVGGTAYIAGQTIWRSYHSGAWSNIVLASLGTGQTFSALQTFTSGLTVSAGTTSLQAVTCTTLTASQGASVQTIGLSSATLLLQVASSGQGRYIDCVDTSGARYNWRFGAQINVNNGFEITPSTAAGGTTYSTPALQIAGATGAATFAAGITCTTLTASGLSTLGTTPGGTNTTGFARAVVQGSDATANDLILAGATSSQTRIVWFEAGTNRGRIGLNYSTGLMNFLTGPTGGIEGLGITVAGLVYAPVGVAVGATALLASERLRVAGGTMGTPGATEVLVAAGKVYAGDTSATSIQTAGGIICTSQVIGTDPGGSELLRVGGGVRCTTLTATGATSDFGAAGNAQTYSRVTGSNSGTAGGAALVVVNNTTTIAGFGNKSVLAGGAYSAQPWIHTYGAGLGTDAGFTCTSVSVGANQVIGAQGAAVADATDAASAITQLNALLARCRAHGLIA
jgi:hypothetical protein